MGYLSIQVEQVLANQLPTILGPMLMGSHLITFWLWLALRLVETIEAHCGYDHTNAIIIFLCVISEYAFPMNNVLIGTPPGIPSRSAPSWRFP